MLTDAQKEARRIGIGGSDAAAIAGLSRYKTPVEVYLEKLGYKELDGGSEAAYWGNVLEEVVANEYQRKTHEAIKHSEQLIKSAQYPWMIANVDRLLPYKNAVLECKTASAYKAQEWGEQDTDEIPDEYLLQCAHYRIVTNCNFVAVAVLIGGQEYRQYKYEKNTNLEEKLIKIEHDFWHKNVLAQEPPTPKTYEEAMALFGKAIDSGKIADDEIKNCLNDYRYLQEHIKELEAKKDLFKAKICNYLEKDAFLLSEFDEMLATWKNKTMKRFDIDRFKKTNPELYSQFLKTTETREFRLKELINE